MLEVKNDQKQKTFISWGLFVVFFAVVYGVIPITYAINDDTAMRDIASGAMSGTPDYHLVFVKAVLGMALSAVYTLFPGVDWYGLFWMGFILVSTAFIFWKMISACEKKGRNPILATALFLAVFTLAVLGHLVNFQFTVVSGILAGAAIFLYHTDESTGIRSYMMTALIILLLWLSFCVRDNVLMMAVPFDGLVFLYKEERIRKKVIMALIAAAGLAGIMALELSAYSAEEWKTYKAYNTARSVVYDYYGVPPYEENREFYDSIGLQEYDVVNLERYQLVFVDGLEEGKMQQIAEYARQKYEEQNSLGARVKAGMKLAVKGELEKETLILNLLAKTVVLAGLILGFRKKWKLFWLNAGFLLSEGALVLYLGYEGRLPARVMTALLMIEFLSALSILLTEWQDNPSEKRKKYPGWFVWTGTALLAVLAVWQFSDIRERQSRITAANQEYELLQHYYQEHPDNVYFIPANWIAGYTENFHIYKEARISNGFSLGGWTTFLPVYEQGMGRLGIENENTAFIEKNNVYLIFSSISSRITSHYEESYEEVSWTEVDKAPVYGMEVPVFKITGGNRK